MREGKHDPHVNQLPPHLHAKFMRVLSTEAPTINLTPAIVRAAVLAHVPLHCVATRCGVSRQRVNELLDEAREPGELFPRARKHRGWGARLDAILNQTD